ncbi:MAG TPA: hypothetical protein IGS37_03335 [Synechococcales cyanobacterium M55_K2018_004]|nr:hypothetical protein [Synechococcales cyanobacterium M55_K2018_004]
MAIAKGYANALDLQYHTAVSGWAWRIAKGISQETGISRRVDGINSLGCGSTA